MALDASASNQSPQDRREYYRITVPLPICLQPETDTTEGTLVEKPVNISGGGLGVMVTEVYRSNDILSVTLLLPDHGRFTAFIEVLRLDPIPYPGGTCRLHARFVRMPPKDRELLIRHILQFQRNRLDKHYSA